MRPELTEAPNDARFIQIVGGHFHFDAITDSETDEPFAHFAGDGGKDLMLVVEFDAKHRAGQHRKNPTFYFNVFFHALNKIIKTAIHCKR